MNSTRTFKLLLLSLWAAAIYARSNTTTTSIKNCVLFQKCVTHGPTIEHPRGYHSDSWSCKLSNVDSERLGGLQFVDLIAESSIEGLEEATSGSSLFSSSEATIDEATASMTIPAHADVHIQDQTQASGNSINVRNLRNNRNLGSSFANSTGTLNTLVIRVIDSNKIGPTSSIDQLIDDVFEDEVSLKTQMEACSYNKLRIEPFQGTTPTNVNIENGVVDIEMDFDINSGDAGGDSAALRAAKDTLGDLDDPMFDLVMVCMPPGPSNDFFAFAFNNSKYSFYNDEWCGYVDAQMHEVGHNLGLAHSGQQGEGEYSDTSGFMGESAGEDDKQQCYNPQKSFQLGWYDDQTRSVDPLGASGPLEFTLNGIADYGKNPEALVVLRLAQENHHQDYYIGYNRATGIHADTSEDADHVTIVRKDFGNPESYGQSTKMASLWIGKEYVLKDFNGSGRDVTVVFSGLSGDNARVTILVDDDNNTLAMAAPSSCQSFTIEVNTDGYPEDNSWYIIDETDQWGRVGATSEAFRFVYHRYAQTICLPRGPAPKTYRFAIEDKYGDGIVLGNDNEEEGYKILDAHNSVIYEGGTNFSKDNTWVYHTLEVEADANYQPTAPPTQAPGNTLLTADNSDSDNNNSGEDSDAPVIGNNNNSTLKPTKRKNTKNTKRGKNGKGATRNR